MQPARRQFLRLMNQNPMLSLTPFPPCSLMPASDTALRQDQRAPATPETLLASLVAHLRDKNLNDAQCVSAIRATLNRLAAG